MAIKFCERIKPEWSTFRLTSSITSLRLSSWLGSRRKRALDTPSVGTTEESENFVRPEDVKDTLLPHARWEPTRKYFIKRVKATKEHWLKLQLSLVLSSSIGINIRTKRSRKSANSRRQGCSLGTCTVHDLAHRLHELGNKYKIGSAPIDKISPQGYGRRRRSLPERRVTLRMEQGRLKPVWSITDSQVDKLEALLRRTWAERCRRRMETKAREWNRVVGVISALFQNSPNASDSCQVFSSTVLFRHEDWVRAALRSYKDWSSQRSSVDTAAGLHSLGAALCLAEGKEEP